MAFPRLNAFGFWMFLLVELLPISATWAPRSYWRRHGAGYWLVCLCAAHSGAFSRGIARIIGFSRLFVGSVGRSSRDQHSRHGCRCGARA